MPRGVRKVSGRDVMLKVLEKHPSGINAAKLIQLIKNQYVITPGQLSSVLCQLNAEHKVTRLGRVHCPECGLSTVRYTVRKYNRQ